MDDVFAPPLSEEEAKQWEIDFSLLPGDEPLPPAEDDPPEEPFEPDTPLPGDDRHRIRATPRTYVYGKRACPCLEAVVHLVEKELVRLGAIKHDLSGLITQGSYSNAVKASAGTHAGGGVWDVKWSLVNTDEKKRAWAGAASSPSTAAPATPRSPSGPITVTSSWQGARTGLVLQRSRRRQPSSDATLC